MTDSVLSDGSVELFQRWLPGGAQGNSEQVFYDGDQFIFAVRVVCAYRDFWEFHAVTACCDPETPLDFRLPNGDPWEEWDWDDVEWFVPVKDFDLPFLQRAGDGT